MLRNDVSVGPAAARNRGAREATGELLFFIDSDVCVQPGTIALLLEVFGRDASLDALIGCYDRHPASPDFLSQYRNLMHAYVHERGATEASTFWSGCGAIRRPVFLRHSGFDEAYGRPAIEDIELGYRLKRAGCRIELNCEVQVKHLKTWSFWGLVKTDVLDRGIPWTELVLRDRTMPNDLNLQLSQRVSVALTFLLMAFCIGVAWHEGGHTLVPLLGVLIVMLSKWWGEAARRPRAAFASLCGLVLCSAAVAFRHGMHAVAAMLLATPALLLLRHRYHGGDRFAAWRRGLGLAYVAGTMALAVRAAPHDWLLLCTFTILVALGLLNSSFYVFLAANRGPAFMLAAIPFHLLYHFYCGLSFVAGAGKFYWRRGAAIRKASRP